MSETGGKRLTANASSEGTRRRRFLSPEKKFQIFLEAQTEKAPVGEILRREGIYSTDLVRIRQKVREGALERLADRPGAKRKMVPCEDYEALKRELEEKERAIAKMAVELAMLRKKRMGVCGRGKRALVGGGTEGGHLGDDGIGKSKRHLFCDTGLCFIRDWQTSCGSLAQEMERDR